QHTPPLVHYTTILPSLILRPEMPRSLSFCVSWINRTLDMLQAIYGRQETCHAAAAEVTRMLEGNNMDRIFAYGLHEFLTEVIDRDRESTRLKSNHVKK